MPERNAKVRTNIRLPQELVDKVLVRGGQNEVIERDLARFYQVIDAAKRDLYERFSEEELHVVVAVWKERLDKENVKYLWAESEIQLTDDRLRLAQHLVEPRQLVEKLRGLSMVELYAMEDGIRLNIHSNQTLDLAFNSRGTTRSAEFTEED